MSVVGQNGKKIINWYAQPIGKLGPCMLSFDKLIADDICSWYQFHQVNVIRTAHATFKMGADKTITLDAATMDPFFFEREQQAERIARRQQRINE